MTPDLASHLANNGGPTETIAENADSVTVDAIPIADCPSTDQRGFPRPDPGDTIAACDIGAYELQDAPLPAGTFSVSYYDVATSAAASASGYGGPGSSGGSGDNTVRIVNPTAGDNTIAQGTICAMVYVFDDREQLQACCGCPVTPDGLRTLSVINDLTLDFGVNKGNLNAGTIEVVSSQPNFFNPNPPPGPNPPGTNGVCSPTGSASTDVRGNPIVPVTTLRNYITHDETIEPGRIANGHVAQGASADEFIDSPLDFPHLSALQSKCNALITGGSGAGVCTCGVGDNGPSNVVVTGNSGR